MIRCATCDRPTATQEEWDTIPEGQGEHLCWGGDQCANAAVDWKERADRYREALEKTLLALRDGDVDALQRIFNAKQIIREVIE